MVDCIPACALVREPLHSILHLNAYIYAKVGCRPGQPPNVKTDDVDRLKDDRPNG